MSRHAQKLLVIATLLLTGGATLVTHAIELAGQYERPGNGTYATVQGGLINRLNYLVRKYQAVAEQNVALAKSHRVGGGG